LISDFGADPSGDLNIFGIISSSWVLAGGLAGMAGANGLVGGALTLMMGTFGMLGNFAEQPDPSTAMKEQLAESFSSLVGSIEKTLKAVFAGEGGSDKLPGQTGTYKTALGRYFSDGKFLLQHVDTMFGDIATEAAKRTVRQFRYVADTLSDW
jgi:hypothetical protein